MLSSRRLPVLASAIDSPRLTPPLRVLVADDGPILRQRLESVLTRDADVDVLDAAARGRLYVSARIAVLLDAMDSGATRDHLTPRESEILRLIASGYTTVEIAARLGRSIRTIESHRAACFGNW